MFRKQGEGEIGDGRGERAVFALALTLLIALGAWWAVALGRAFDETYQVRLAVLDPVQRALGAASRIELDAWHHGRRLMILGEGTLLVLLIAVCAVMLYRLATEQRRVREQLEAFVGQATHEMKTPLAGLRALLQTIRLRRLPAARLDDAVDQGLRQVERQERLIQNMLMGHRVRFARQTFAIAATPLRPLVDRLIRERSGVGARGCGFSAVGGEKVLVRADIEAVQTIIENLFENAVRYGATEVRVRLDAAGARVHLAVEDNGNGFDPSASETLFAPFRRGASAAIRGTGLGLPLSRELAQAMGGALSGNSKGEGQGATFTLTLAEETG